MPVIVGTLLVGTGLVGAAAAASTVGGALYYKYRKMERRKLSKNATSGLFGAVLDTMEPKYIDNSTGIPRVIEDIFKELEKRMSTTNLFYMSGSVTRIKKLHYLYEGAKYDEIILSEEDTHDLCALVIHYLQSLPEPLCTLLLYQDFLDIHNANRNDKEQWIKTMRSLFHCLPELNRRLFIRILQFFELVAITENNQVSREYLVNLLGPLCFYGQSDEKEEEGKKKKLKYNTEVVPDMLNQLLFLHQEVFPLKLEDLPPWETTRAEDSNIRKSQSELPIDDNNTVPSSPDINGDKTTVKEKTKGAWKTLRGNINQITRRYRNELEDTPPPNTFPVNYVTPIIEAK